MWFHLIWVTHQFIHLDLNKALQQLDGCLNAKERKPIDWIEWNLKQMHFWFPIEKDALFTLKVRLRLTSNRNFNVICYSFRCALYVILALFSHSSLLLPEDPWWFFHEQNDKNHLNLYQFNIFDMHSDAIVKQNRRRSARMSV